MAPKKKKKTGRNEYTFSDHIRENLKWEDHTQYTREKFRRSGN